MSASGPRSRGARVHPRSCQGCQPWPRASAASGLVLATQKLDGITGRRTDAPSSNTCRLLARDHAAPESTLALAKAASLGRERVRPLAWCSRTRKLGGTTGWGTSAPSSNTCRLLARNWAALPEGALMDDPLRSAATRIGSDESIGRIVANLAGVVHAPAETLQLTVLSLLAEGHLIIEDLPGVGKTTLAKALARSIDCSFSRLQFTPDLLPSYVSGVNVFKHRSYEFEFRPGQIGRAHV